jgi:hypothetical protein
MKYLALLALLLASPAFSQTVASCPTATPAAWSTGAFLPCVSLAYIGQPVPATAVIGDLRGAVGSWQLASAVLPTDQVWAKTTAVPAGTWVLASTLTFATSAPPAINSTAVLKWTAPTQNVNGTALTNLASYNIYEGTSAATVAKVANVLAPATTYTVTGLTPGTYYFTVTAVNSASPAVESAQASPDAVGTVSAPVVTTATPQAPGSVSVTITVSVP